VNVRVYEDAQELAAAAAEAFVERAQQAIGRSGRFAVALAGGSTPKLTYEVLAAEHGGALDWGGVHVFFGDERTVSPDHEDSNYRMAREALLDHVPVGSIFRMRGEMDPTEAAASYEEELRGFFGEEPRFDLILCGLGEDGHTLSLFPKTPALDVTDRWVVDNPVPKLDATRLTLTVPAANAAHSVDFLVSGEGKAEALREILEGDPDPHLYPAKLIAPAGGPNWLVDRAATSRIRAA
jgi:6-phosphogluconolactonase